METRVPSQRPRTGEVNTSSVGHVGVEECAVGQRVPAAVPLGPRDEPALEVRAVGRLVVEVVQIQGVELFAVGLQLGVVGLPLCHGVVVLADAHGLQNGLPQLFHRGAGALPREDLLGPFFGGHRDDAPLVLVIHGVVVGLESHAPGGADFCIFSTLTPLRPSGSAEEMWIIAGRVST